MPLAPSSSVTSRRTRLHRAGALLGLLCAAFAPAQAAEIRIGSSGATQATLQRLAEAYGRLQPDVTITVMPADGSTRAIASTLAGTVQIGVSARAPTEDERRAGAAALELARTPVVLATSREAQATGLRSQDVVDAYAGRLRQWPDGTPVNLVLRPPGDVETAALQTLSPAVGAAVASAAQRPGVLCIDDEQESARLLEKLPGALGPVSLSLLRAERRALRPLAIDGVRPTPEAIRDGRYPLMRSVYVVTSAQASGPVQDFVAFMRSPWARRILQENGHWVP